MSTLEAKRPQAVSTCGVCGHTLSEVETQLQLVGAHGGGRWVCPVCGAHRVPLPE